MTTVVKDSKGRTNIPRTNRIVFKHCTIYCSGDVMSKAEVKELIMRGNQKFFPLKDCQYRLFDVLKELARKNPNWFATGSLVHLRIER